MTPCQHKPLVAKGWAFTHEFEPGCIAHELLVVLVPRVGDCGAIRDDQNLLEFELLAEVVDGKSLTESGLGVPQELTVLRVGFNIFLGESNRLSLLLA